MRLGFTIKRSFMVNNILEEDIKVLTSCACDSDFIPIELDDRFRICFKKSVAQENVFSNFKRTFFTRKTRFF